MRYLVFTALFFCIIFLSRGQVGINTSNPEAMLDIAASNSVNPENTDGILIPRVSKFPDTNPTPDKDGILIYLNTTAGQKTPGFYSWNAAQSRWLKLLNNVNMMLANKSGTELGLVGGAFNYTSIKYNDIYGASFNSSNQLSLPIGIYEIESNFTSGTGVNISWNMRLNGSIYPASVPGTSSSISLLGSGITSTTLQKAVVVINDENDYIDFVITSGLTLGLSLTPSTSYLKIKKLG